MTLEQPWEKLVGPSGLGRGKVGENVLRQETLGVSEEQNGGCGRTSCGTQVLCEVREVGWAGRLPQGLEFLAAGKALTEVKERHDLMCIGLQLVRGSAAMSPLNANSNTEQTAGHSWIGTRVQT